MVHFDYEKVRTYFDDEKVVLQAFLALLQKELPRSRAEIESRFAEKDLNGIVAAAHKVKGTALSAGLDELTRIATRLNKLTAFDEAVIGSLITELVNEINIILPFVADKLKA